MKTRSGDNASLTVPSLSRTRSLSPDAISLVSADVGDLHELRLSRTLSNTPAPPTAGKEHSPAPARSIRGRIHAAWRRNLGLTLVLIAQFFGVLMNITTRLLEQGSETEEAMHPFQVRSSHEEETSILYVTDHLCAYVDYVDTGMSVHVVDENSRLSFWSKRRSLTPCCKRPRRFLGCFRTVL